MSQTYSPEAPPTSRLSFVLLLVWAACTLGAVGFVFAFVSNAPYADEWEFVPALLGEEPFWPWLWQQHNEHRLPLPRLIYYPLFQLTHDFRSGSLLQVVMLSLLALALMRLAVKLRGYSSWVDAFFPVSLLHLGHWENFIMGYQLCFSLFTVLATGLVIVALRTSRETLFPFGCMAGVLALLLAFTGGSGLVASLPVAGWLVYLAVLLWKDGRGGRAVTLLAFATAIIGYLALYFAGYERPPGHPPTSRDPVAVSMVTGEVLSMAFGYGVAGVWWLVLAGELVVGVAALVLVLRSERLPSSNQSPPTRNSSAVPTSPSRGEVNPRTSPLEGEVAASEALRRVGGALLVSRPAAVGLLAVVAGVCGVALAIGFGRAPMGSDMGLWSRYGFLAWPLLGAAFLVSVKAGRKTIPAVLCVVALLALPTNTGTGLAVGRGIHEHYQRMEVDAKAGLSTEAIIARNFPESPNAMQGRPAARAIPLLRANRIGIFATEGERGVNWWLVGAILAIVLMLFAMRWVWHLCKAVMAERARELFRLQHERYEEQLLHAASATGLPRGLRWMKCAITGDALLVRDITNGGIVALVPVLLEFEPLPDSDMMDNPAAREPRPATAVFTFSAGTWTTSGRVVFNHTPEQTIAAFAPQFRVIHHGHH